MQIQLNYHHLRYFWLVAKSGNLTQVAYRRRTILSKTIPSRHLTNLVLSDTDEVILPRTRSIVRIEGVWSCVEKPYVPLAPEPCGSPTGSGRDHDQPCSEQKQ